MIAAIIALGGFVWVKMNVDEMRREQYQAEQQTQDIQTKLSAIRFEADKFKDLDDKVKQRQARLKILGEITGKKVDRFKPVLILDMLQLLKPQGVWFSTLTISPKGAEVKIEGGSYDNLLLSEFLLNLRITASQEIDATDIRTKVYFDSLNLSFSRLANGNEIFPDVGEHYRFAVTFTTKEQADAGPRPKTAYNVGQILEQLNSQSGNISF
mgnify:CR=1 FL=1